MANIPTPSQEEKKFQAQDDLRTLTRAAEIKKDSDRMKRVMSEAKSQMEALKKVKKQ